MGKDFGLKTYTRRPRSVVVGNRTCSTAMAEDAAGAHIQLKVKDQQGSEVQFKIKKSTPLRKLMDAYCSRLGLQASQVRFMVDGERIGPDDTAEKLGLEDEDLIDVAMEQTGGISSGMDIDVLMK